MTHILTSFSGTSSNPSLIPRDITSSVNRFNFALVDAFYNDVTVGACSSNQYSYFINFGESCVQAVIWMVVASDMPWPNLAKGTIPLILANNQCKYYQTQLRNNHGLDRIIDHLHLFVSVPYNDKPVSTGFQISSCK